MKNIVIRDGLQLPFLAFRLLLFAGRYLLLANKAAVRQPMTSMPLTEPRLISRAPAESAWRESEGERSSPSGWSYAAGFLDRPNRAAFSACAAGLPVRAATNWAPSGLPSPVHGSHPSAAIKEPLLPSVMS